MRLEALAGIACVACGRVGFEPTPDEPAAVKAFPTAEGFGASSRGGRGGRVIAVTTLADSGPGSFREAINTAEPRIIVFRVGGTIRLTSSITLDESYVTIAGQTAPGDGIAITGNVIYVVRVHDVVIRHMRFRSADDPANRPDNEDPIGISGSVDAPAHDIILDHVSASWGSDDCLSVHGGRARGGVRNVTVQWSIVAEGLHCNYLSSACAASGSILGYGTENLTMHHSLWAHHWIRSPELAGMGGCQGCDVVNNVIYDWGFRGTTLGAGTTANLVKNVYRRGPTTPTTGPTEVVFFEPATVYLEGNDAESIAAGDQWAMTQATGMSPAPTSYRAGARFAAPAIAEHDPAALVPIVLDGAGATRPRRDATDQRVVAQVAARTGGMVSRVFAQSASDSPNPGPSDVPEGTFPSYAGGVPYPDDDADGIDDDWERAHGLDPSDGGDGGAVAANGYTNVENFLNELAGDRW